MAPCLVLAPSARWPAPCLGAASASSKALFGLERTDIPWRFLCRGSWILFYVIEAAAVITVLNTYPDDAEAAVRAACKAPCMALFHAYCPAVNTCVLLVLGPWSLPALAPLVLCVFLPCVGVSRKRGHRQAAKGACVWRIAEAVKRVCITQTSALPTLVVAQTKSIKSLVTLPKKMLPLRLALFKQLLLLGSKGLQPAAAVAAPEAPPLAGGVGNMLSFPRSRAGPSAGAVLAPPKPHAPAEEVEAPATTPQPVRTTLAHCVCSGLAWLTQAVHAIRHRAAAGEGGMPQGPCGPAYKLVASLFCTLGGLLCKGQRC